MKRSVAMMACVLSGALMIGSYSPVLAKTEAKAVSATATDKDGAEAKTDAAKADDKKEILQKVRSWKTAFTVQNLIQTVECSM